MHIVDILKMPDGPEKAKELAISGLLGQVNEWWHKQWYLERILEALGCDLAKLREELQSEDYDWKDGIAP